MYLGRCVFDINADFQRDLQNTDIKKLEEICEKITDELPIIQLSNLMPFLAHPLHDFLVCLLSVRKTAVELIPTLRNYIEEFPAFVLIDQIKKVINHRRKSSSKTNEHMDFLQLMIDAPIDDETPVNTCNNTKKILFEHAITIRTSIMLRYAKHLFLLLG